MPLDNQSEQDTTDASNQRSTDDSRDRSGGLPPGVNAPQPPQAPAPQNPSTERPDQWWKDRKFILEVLAFLLLLAYTASSWLQWGEMSRTNLLTREALSGSNQSLSETLAEMQEQADDMSRLADNAQKQADRTKDIAQTSNEALISVQRAFVFPIPIETPTYAANGKTQDGIDLQIVWQTPEVRRPETCSLSPMLSK